MASNTLTNKGDLKNQALRVIRRSGAQTMIDDMDNMVTLAEAMLNRELPPVEVDTALVGVLNSRRIDITSISLVKPVALFYTPTGSTQERLLRMESDGSVEYQTVSSIPTSWALDGTGSYIDFNCPLIDTFAIRFRNIQRFSLANDSATNWLMTNHPDVYLAAVIVWGYARMEDIANAAQWQKQLDDGIASVKSILTQLKRAELVVDPSFQLIGRRRRGMFNIMSGV